MILPFVPVVTTAILTFLIRIQQKTFDRLCTKIPMSGGAITDDKDFPRFYPIGTPGKPWEEAEFTEWKKQVKIQRSYKEEVIDQLESLLKDSQDSGRDWFEIKQYGSLSHNSSRYPLISVQSKDFDADKPFVLVTGGVHGYETSGVQGAIAFVRTEALKYSKDFNLIVCPCVSPWAYEHIQRWQADLADPNRSFQPNDESKQTEESKALIAHMRRIEQEFRSQNKGDAPFWKCHFDLHETTDTDLTEFRPAKQAKAGLPPQKGGIPDGFYLVADNVNPQLGFQKAVIAKVKKVTHIAPPDEKGTILDEPVLAEGIIQVPARDLGLCGAVTLGEYTTTTEVYPDSLQATDEICNQAQVAAIVGGLDYILKQ